MSNYPTTKPYEWCTGCSLEKPPGKVLNPSNETGWLDSCIKLLTFYFQSQESFSLNVGKTLIEVKRNFSQLKPAVNGVKEYGGPEGKWWFWSVFVIGLWKLCSLAGLDTHKPPETTRSKLTEVFFTNTTCYNKAGISFSVLMLSALFKCKLQTGSGPSVQLRAYLL